MNNSEYNQLLADTMLMPFIAVDFNQNDLLCNYVTHIQVLYAVQSSVAKAITNNQKKN